MSSSVRQEIKRAFQVLMKENEGFYVVRNLEDRLYCCQALKKRTKKHIRKICWYSSFEDSHITKDI